MILLSELHIKTCLFADEAIAIRTIRKTVFQEEQGISADLDWDGLDERSLHVIAKVSDENVGVARLREVGDLSKLKLERLAVLAQYRHQGIGSEMVLTAIAYARTQGYEWIELHAQFPTVGFYESLGFSVVGETFEEAGIAHLKMELNLIGRMSRFFLVA